MEVLIIEKVPVNDDTAHISTVYVCDSIGALAVMKFPHITDEQLWELRADMLVEIERDKYTSTYIKRGELRVHATNIESIPFPECDREDHPIKFKVLDDELDIELPML